MARSYWTDALSKRYSRRRALAATGGVAAAAAFLAACGGSDSGGDSGGQAKSGSDLVVQIHDETKTMKRGGIYKSTLGTPPSLDPHGSGSQVTHVWMNYSQLYKIKPGYLKNSDGDVEGDLLQSWEMSPDKLTLTAKIVADTKFTPKPPVNGRTVDMEDVLFSWNRYKETSPRRAELAAEKDPNAPVQSLTSPDARTLVIKFTKPVATILSSLAGGSPGTFYIVPREAEDTNNLNLRSTLAGSGPFYLEEWVPSAKTIFRRNPGFKLDKRNVPYLDGVDFIDLTEASAVLAQFKAGQIYDTFNNFLPDDILPTKRDIPALEIMASQNYAPSNIRAFFGHEPNSPFKDERVRQAYALLWDRDLFFEAMLNVKRFQDQGLPVQTGYDNALRGQSYEGWWLDPTSKEFGPNSKYFKHDPAEAKKLLSAAGVNSALEYNVHFGTLARHTPAYSRWVETLNGFERDSGLFKPTNKELDFSTEWQTFRFNKGKFVGQAYIFDTGENDPANDLYSHYHSSGSRVFGIDSEMDALADKMLAEYDVKKRISLAQDIQRLEGKKMLQPRPGGATSFRITWPALRNKNVWQGENQGRYLSTIWLDQTKPPFKT